MKKLEGNPGKRKLNTKEPVPARYDVEINMTSGAIPLSMEADFLLPLCELVAGGKEGLQPIEKTVIDRCVIWHHVVPERARLIKYKRACLFR